MHESGVKTQIKSKCKPQTTKADPDAKAYDNLRGQNFAVQKSNAVWLADLTYIRVGGKWCYLAAVLDLARRKLVGWSIGTPNSTACVSGAENGNSPGKSPRWLNPSFRSWQSIYVERVSGTA